MTARYRALLTWLCLALLSLPLVIEAVLGLQNAWDDRDEVGVITWAAIAFLKSEIPSPPRW